MTLFSARICLVNRLLHSYQKSILRGRGDVDSRKYVPMIVCSPLIASPCFGPAVRIWTLEEIVKCYTSRCWEFRCLALISNFHYHYHISVPSSLVVESLSLSCQSLGLIFPYSRGPCIRHQYCTPQPQSVNQLTQFHTIPSQHH